MVFFAPRILHAHWTRKFLPNKNLNFHKAKLSALQRLNSFYIFSQLDSYLSKKRACLCLFYDFSGSIYMWVCVVKDMQENEVPSAIMRLRVRRRQEPKPRWCFYYQNLLKFATYAQYSVFLLWYNHNHCSHVLFCLNLCPLNRTICYLTFLPNGCSKSSFLFCITTNYA